MLNSLLRLLKGETVFTTTVYPNKYRVGSVVAKDVSSGVKVLFKVTGVTKVSSTSRLYSVWGLEKAFSDSSTIGNEDTV